MSQPFQKAALALLICAPSTLNRKWREGATRDELRQELVTLGFSDTFIENVGLDTLARQSQMQEAFRVVSVQLLADPWDGVEPHPRDPDGQAIVAALRALDNE